MNIITQLPLEDLRDSPTNPRQHYTEQGLEELAADIRTHGRVLSPILVRPHIPELFRHAPDAEAARCGYEIVFGHRRVRAARLAGLTHIPAMVQSLSDAEVIAAQVSENLAREDVTVIEEADGFAQLMRTSKLTADDIANRFGRSRSYVYARLKLLHLTDNVRKAVTAGEIDAEVAQLLGRLKHPKLQERALSLIKGKSYDTSDGGKRSFRDIQTLLREQFTTSIKDAPFDTADADLVPKAGPCHTCPHRSGNDPAFTDIATAKVSPYAWERTPIGADVCTDPECWAVKKEAHCTRTAAKLREEGFEVVTGAKAKQAIGVDGKLKGAYVDAQKITPTQRAMLPSGAVPVKVLDPRTAAVMTAYAVGEEVQAAGTRRQTAEERRAIQTQNDAVRDADNTRRVNLWLSTRKAATTRARTTQELRLIVKWMLHEYRSQTQVLVAWGVNTEEELIERLPASRPMIWPCSCSM